MNLANIATFIQFFFAIVIGLYFWNLLKSQQGNKVAVERESKKEIEKLVIKGSVVEGQFLDAPATEALAKMPNKRELQSMIVGQILGPGRKLAGQIVGPGSNIGGIIKAVIEKREKETPAAA
jgi:ribosomal protein L10